MTGPEHYTEAERLIAGAHAEAKEAGVYGMLLAEAQVHATLALAAVHAMSAACDGESAGLTSTEWRAWNRVAGES